MERAVDIANAPSFWGAGLRTAAMLCLVLGLLILVLFLMKRFLVVKQSLGQGRLIKILSSYHVTPKGRIALIDVAGEKLVVGITPENIHCLNVIEKPEVLKRIEEGCPGRARGGVFAELLMSSRQGRTEKP